MWDSNQSDFQYDLNPYDSFMRKHLEHYGYYTGRNQGFRHNFSSYAEWEKTYGYQLSSGTDSDSDSGSDSDKKADDNKLQEELLRTTQLVYSYKDGKGMVPKLREPRNLYALSKELGPQQAARWPADIQVLTENVRHIRFIPPEPEPFYKPTGAERMPMVRGEENGGRLVYMYEPRTSFNNYDFRSQFVRSRVGGLRSGPQKCNIDLDTDEDTTLIFESRFESGNLAKAVQVNETDYELWLRYDLYTNKHTQWFYFRVSNTRANKTYRFTIVNFMKSDSLYNFGMKPLIYSEKNAHQKKIGWFRGGSDIKYYKNNLRYSSSKSDRSFYSLTWTVQFQHNNDTVYFAHCYPYTYTDLQDYLLDLSNDPIKAKICKQRVLCRTLAGNLVYVLTITSPSQNPEDIKHKKAVVITARVHPGECNASWMMKGFLDYLVGNSADAKLLRDTFIFKIVPMLNPDGVIVGNYRCSLAGRDLNRNYKTVLKDSYPSVWHTKNMIRKLLQEREIIVYCDLHGHSRKQNVFIYGCENRHNAEKRLKERVFPLMLHKNAPELFKYESCKFKVQKSKEGTGRIVMWNMGIMNSYTMEATFCGSTLGKKKGFHFSVEDYEDLGYHFCDTLLDYCDPDNTKSTNILLELEDRLKKEIMIRLQNTNLTDINLSDYSSEEIESSDGGSDSSVSDGPPVHLQYATSRPVKKKKKLKSKKERDRSRSSIKPEEPKKPVVQERPNSDHICDKKSTPSMHQQSHTKQDKQTSPAPMKYTLAVKRPKSHEDRTSNSQLISEKNIDKSRQNDYLEALTNAYLRNGLLVQEPAAAHFRYSSNSSKVPSPLPLNFGGLCAHHEQTLAAQIMAQQIQNMNSGASIKSVIGRKARRMTPTMRALPVPVVGNTFVKVWKERIQTSRRCHYQPSVDDIVRSQITHQASISPISRQPVQRHILEVSAAQQRQQDNLLQARHHGDKSEKSNRPRAHVPSATTVNYENYDSKEVTTKPVEDENLPVPEEASQHSQDKESQNEVKSHGDQEEDDSKRHSHRGKHKERGGRKSRLGMRESDDDHVPGPEGPNYLVDPHKPQGPRVKSARKGKDMDQAIESIKELRQSLANNAIQQQTLSPTTGGYIKRLMKETDNDIEELTKEIRHDIEYERKLARVREKTKINAENKEEENQSVKSNSEPGCAPDIVISDSSEHVQEVKKEEVVEYPIDKSHSNHKIPARGGNVTDSQERRINKLKSRSVTSYPVSDRYNYERPPKWPENTLIVNGDQTMQHYSIPGNQRLEGTNHHKDRSEGVSGGIIHRLNVDKSIELTNISGPATIQHRNTYVSSTMTTPAQTVYNVSQPSRYQELNCSGFKSKSAKDYRNGISSILNGQQREEKKPTDKYFEHAKRVKSAKSGRHSVGKELVSPNLLTEAVPTKIQLMISQDHQEEKTFGGQFLPLSRTIRAPFYRNNTCKRKQ